MGNSVKLTELIKLYNDWSSKQLKNDVTLLKYYENMVNWDKRFENEGAFLMKTLKDAGAKRILDCGCGVGRHVIYLSKHGFSAEGCDYNPYHVKRASELAQKEGVKTKFFQADMENLSGVRVGEYDAILTLGNTLTSFGKEKAANTIKCFGKLLKTGGIVIGQVLNYNSFEKTDRTEIRWTEPGENETIFLKTFHFEPEHVVMVVNLLERTPDGWNNHPDTTNMYYLEKEFLEESLKDAGFTAVKFYGGLTGEEFDREKSRDLVFTAVK
jgi:glycine/sarcosine N-methyltransferase